MNYIYIMCVCVCGEFVSQYLRSIVSKTKQVSTNNASVHYIK